MESVFSKFDVAIHEGGHAVCNHFFGLATEKIVLTFQPELNEWHGKTHAVPQEAPVRIRTSFSFGAAVPAEPPDFSPLTAQCVIAAAGYFAQVLKAGRDSSPDLQLSDMQDWTGLLGWLFDKRLVTQKPELRVEVTTSGKLDYLSIPSRAFSSGDQRTYCNIWDIFEKLHPKDSFLGEHVPFEQRLIDDLRRFFAFLNRPETWQALCDLAKLLDAIEASPSVLEGDQLYQVLRRLRAD